MSPGKRLPEPQRFSQPVASSGESAPPSSWSWPLGWEISTVSPLSQCSTVIAVTARAKSLPRMHLEILKRSSTMSTMVLWWEHFLKQKQRHWWTGRAETDLLLGWTSRRNPRAAQGKAESSRQRPPDGLLQTAIRKLHTAAASMARR